MTVRRSVIKERIQKTECVRSGRVFRRQELVDELQMHQSNALTRPLTELIDDGVLVRKNKQGYYQRSTTPPDYSDMATLVKEIDAGRTTLSKHVDLFPWSYETLRKKVRPFRLGIGFYS